MLLIYITDTRHITVAIKEKALGSHDYGGLVTLSLMLANDCVCHQLVWDSNYCPLFCFQVQLMLWCFCNTL